jgi:hypothetical protein
MKSYFEQKDKIEKGRLAEIRYEDLVSNPIEEVKRIYSELNISGFEEALPRMQKYLKERAGYRADVYNFDKEVISKVKEKWGFTIERWGYKV